MPSFTQEIEKVRVEIEDLKERVSVLEGLLKPKPLNSEGKIKKEGKKYE
jgi:hypothetical protein